MRKSARFFGLPRIARNVTQKVVAGAHKSWLGAFGFLLPKRKRTRNVRFDRRRALERVDEVFAVLRIAKPQKRRQRKRAR